MKLSYDKYVKTVTKNIGLSNELHIYTVTGRKRILT